MFDLARFAALDRRVWFLALTRLVATAGFSMAMPLMTVYLTQDRHLAVWAAGLVMTAAGACGAVLQSYAGTLSDRTGRVPMIWWASVLRTVNLGLLGLCVAREGPLVLLVLLFVVNNLARAFIDPPTQALVADLTPVSQRVDAFALQRIGINIGFAGGPAAAFFAMGHGVPYHRLFYWSVPIGLLAVWLLLPLRALRPTRPPTPVPPGARTALPWLRELLAHRRDHALMWFLAATFLFSVLQIQLFVTLPIFGARTLGLPKADVMTIFTVNGLLVVLLQLPAAALINRLGRTRALMLGCLGYALSYSALSLSRGLGSLLACVAAITLAEVVLSPAQHAQVTTLAPVRRIGAYSGLFGFAQLLGQSSGPSIGTAILDLAPDRAAWFLLALFGLCGAWGYGAASRARRPDDEFPRN